MKRGTVGRFTLLATLYFAQGLPFGFFIIFLPLRLRDASWSLTKIGLASLLAAPWALKWLWAPYLDHTWLPRIGRRRTWILAMQLAGTLVLASLAATASGGDLTVLLCAAFVLNLIAATQDVASDGLAVELLPPDERGIANGLQVGAYRIGMIVGGGVLLELGETLGFRGQLATMAALTALASLPVLLVPEPATVATEARVRGERSREPHFLRLPGVWKLLLVVVLYKFGESFGGGMLKLFLRDGGMTDAELGRLTGTVGSAAGLVGAFAGGALVSSVGRFRSLVVFGIAQAVTLAGYAYLAIGAPSLAEIYAWTAFEHIASGMATAALFTSMMDWSRPYSSGTDYTVQASAVVIAQLLAPAMAGFVADAVGYAWHFTIGAVLCALAVAAVVALYPRGGVPWVERESR